MKGRDHTLAARRAEHAAASQSRSDDALRRYRVARERLEVRRKGRADRFAYLKRAHD